LDDIMVMRIIYLKL